MSQHYQLGLRYLVLRDVFTSGDSANNLLYRPDVDAADLVSDYAVIDCVESHMLKIADLDPQAPDDAVGLRFMAMDGSIWDCQYPTYLVEDSRDDHIDGNRLVTPVSAVAGDKPYIDAGVVLGLLYRAMEDQTLSDEARNAIGTYLSNLENKIFELGMNGKVTVIYLPAIPVETPPAEEEPTPEGE